jgi:hypothetical protein
LILVISGTILLALDRLIGKDAVIRIDRRMEMASDQFKPLNWRKHILFLLVGMTCFSFYMAIRIDGFLPPDVFVRWLLIISLIGVVYWMLAGLVLTFRISNGKPLWISFLLARIAPFFLSGFSLSLLYGFYCTRFTIRLKVLSL